MKLSVLLLAMSLASGVHGATNTPAHQSARMFMRGANLGNYLEAPPGQNWGASYTAADFAAIRREGFDHVRIPIGWHHFAGPAPDYVIANAAFQKVNFMVTNALAQNLAVIINIHHFDAFYKSPATHADEFYALWRQIAAGYSNYPPQLAFELINEPMDAATTTIMNPIYGEAIRQIRLTNPLRTVFVGPGKWNSIDELDNLRLPENDQNLIVTVHCYEPFLFTHQGASWTGTTTATTGIIFPGPPPAPLAAAPGVPGWVTNWISNYNRQPAASNPSSPEVFKKQLAKARAWADARGRPVHIGEFGCYIKADPASRTRFYAEFRAAADALHLGWAIWDWKAGFRYWDDKTSQPVPGMREALFPR